MNQKTEKDEHMERLWYLKEENNNFLKALKNTMGEDFKEGIIEELINEELMIIDKQEGKILLTEKGENYARKLIRAHRIAESLLFHALGREVESGACEFEHIVTPELVDSICILLGHPRECPHGLPIPRGECCKQASKVTQSLVIPLTELAVGDSGRIAYVNCRNDRQLHRIDGLHIRPGIRVKLHQKCPCYVIECEDANIALDEQVVSSICVWKEEKCPSFPQTNNGELKPKPKSVGKWRRRFRFRTNK
ncbi:MAG: metal-dependent transcriptional regulator [Candidatus Omnitrophota bacterium]